MAGAHKDVDVFGCYCWCGVELTAELHRAVDGEKVVTYLKQNKQLYIQMVAILLLHRTVQNLRA